MSRKYCILPILTGMALAAGAADYAGGFDRASELWEHWKSAKAKGRFAYRADYGHRAPGALMITVEEGNPREEGGLVFTRQFDGEPGRSYTFVVYAAHAGVNPDAVIALSIQGLDKDGAFLGTGVQGTQLPVRELKAGVWRRLLFTFRVPESAEWSRFGKFVCSLGVMEGQTGEVYFDDFEFFADEEGGE